MFQTATIIWAAVGLLNIIGFILVRIDKSKAIHHQWRIRERTFFGLALLGGSIGVYGGCLLFRHKTKHGRFMFGLPAIIITQGWLIYHFHLV